MASYDNYKGKVLSFDIETTGIDPGNMFGAKIDGIEKKDIQARIWSTAFHNPETDKIHETIYKSPNQIKEAAALQNAEFYSENKAFKDYITSNHSTFENHTDIAKGLNRDFKNSGINGGMILIQNAQFENKWTKWQQRQAKISGSETIDILDNQLYHSIDGNELTGQLFVPKSVHEIKQKLYNGRDSMSIESMDSLYDEMMKVYSEETEKAARDGKLITGDLMDFTAATYTKAVKQGYLDKTYLHKGRGIEFMAGLFLGEEELHSAGSDARQQSKIFEHILGLRDRLISENLTEEDLKIFGKMNLSAQSVREGTAARGALGFIDGLNNGLVNTSGFDIDQINVPIKNTVTGEIENISVQRRKRDLPKSEIIPSFLRNTETNEGTIAYQKILEAHNKYGEDAVDYIKNEDFINELKGIKQESQENIKNILSDDSIEPAKQKIRTDSINNKIKTISEKFAHDYKSGVENSPELLKAILPKTTKGGALLATGTAAVGGLWALSHTNNDSKAEEYKIRTRRNNLNNSLDSTINIYTPSNKPELNYGYARAQWENRIGHHEYGQ